MCLFTDKILDDVDEVGVGKSLLADPEPGDPEVLKKVGGGGGGV